MERLAKSSRRIIWVNPLLRFGDFAAKAGGIRAMLPYVNSFRPIHNLASMAELCRALSGPEDASDDPQGCGSWRASDSPYSLAERPRRGHFRTSHVVCKEATVSAQTVETATGKPATTPV